MAIEVTWWKDGKGEAREVPFPIQITEPDGKTSWVLSREEAKQLITDLSALLNA